MEEIHMTKRIALTLIGILLVYGSVAFAIKGGIGVLPVDAAITTLGGLIHMKVGTFSMLFHGSFFVGQILIEKKEFKKIQFLQIGYIVFGGSILNFMLYTVLGGVSFSWYPIRLVICVAAFFVSAFGCTLVLEMKVIRTPMEGFIQMVAERIGTTMGMLRQKIDVVLVVVTVVLTLIFHTSWTLREGTVIAALIFGPFMDFHSRWIRMVLNRQIPCLSKN